MRPEHVRHGFQAGRGSEPRPRNRPVEWGTGSLGPLRCWAQENAGRREEMVELGMAPLGLSVLGKSERYCTRCGKLMQMISTYFGAVRFYGGSGSV
ncbi:hypothetical protein NDU88_004572 [Pleurodeles waltl]|uniref:Uncharacterized protein n=1 Tax=Pleurodeles waltl TaxID=8319 RepID=A0AAV7LK85_PLEWA|nr:hypothetical protein NDU88_004572 [Pleurodeles waltl]